MYTFHISLHHANFGKFEAKQVLLLFSGHRREGLLRRGSDARGGLQGGSPPFLILGQIGTFSEPFFLNFVYISWIMIKPITTIF